MFIEPNWQSGAMDFPKKRGWIEVISGCMFSGKTEELIRRVNRAVIARQKVKIFKPSVDTRYHDENVVSHNENFVESTPISSSAEIMQLKEECHVIAIDEVQFFDEQIANVCNALANQGKRVIVAGIDMDFTGKPFKNLSDLMSIAEFVTKIHAICAICGANASYSYRLSNSPETFLLGARDVYEARCRECFNSAK
jgi:thymidine kinase